MTTKIKALARKFIGLASVLALFSFGITLIAPGSAVAAACAPTGTTYGTDTMTVNVPASGTYYVWSRLLDPSTSVNSIDLQVGTGSSASCYQVGGSSSVTANTWTWVDYASGNTGTPISMSLSSGNNTFEYIGTEAGIGLDSLLLTQDPSCVPTGTGTNCISTTPNNPAAPTNVKATANSATSATVTWSASTDTGGPGIGGYYVYLNGTKITPNGVTTTSYTDSSLSPSTTYSFTVEAYDTSSPPLVSSASGAASVTTPSQVVNKPTPPTSVTASANSSTSATVSWSGAADTGGPGIGGYYVLLDGSNITPSGVTTTSYTDSSLSPSTNYSFTIETYDKSSPVLVSSPSTAASVTTPSKVVTSKPPTSPVLTASASTSTSVSLKWTASTDTGGPGLGGYDVARELAGSTTGYTIIAPSLSPSITSYVDSTVSASTSYNYEIIAFDTSSPMMTAVSNNLAVTTPASSGGGGITQPPSVPAGVIAKANSPTSVTVTWNVSTDSDSTISGYYIYRGGVEINGVKGSNATGTMSSTDPTAMANTSYEYQVEAYNAAGQVSGLSADAPVTTPKQASTGPTAPQNLTGTAVGSSQVNLSWTASSSTAGISDYLVYENGSEIAPVTTTSYGVTGLNASTQYSFYVVAVDTNSIKSADSNTVEVTTGAASTNTATLEGVVKSTSGTPLSGVYVVSGKNASTTGTVKTYTNSAGQYVLSGLKAGLHSFSFSANEYKPHTYDWHTPIGVTVKNVNLIYVGISS